jgi:hypothetical protein
MRAGALELLSQQPGVHQARTSLMSTNTSYVMKLACDRSLGPGALLLYSAVGRGDATNSEEAMKGRRRMDADFHAYF